ncbi:L-cystine transporter [Paenibacillus selenitireducens]|uniref:L-cystine uptake protein TcyP n=1 Tax=Paenibacillus selenitireducens TaxID=1324314 RepID=A0A1T2X7B0_9BACL|nr:L-cystine transporter [Paenibacillus selenitireducens]OPA75769.1 L-cystine transporter [Paenibacillus selenitireducens]
MELLSTIVNVVILIALIGLLWYMQKKHVSFSKRVFTGLGLGVIFGVSLQLIFGRTSNVISDSVDWFSLVGNGYVKLLQMVAIPLIMVSIISAIIKVKANKGVGKISTLVIGILLFTTAISAAVGITSALGFNLKAVNIEQGDKETKRGEYLTGKLADVEHKTLPQQVLDVIPSNPFDDMTGARSTSTIAVVIFSAFIGVALRGISKKKPVEAETFTKLVEAVYAVVMRIVTLVLRLTPYGILALIAKVTATTNYDEIAKLGQFVIASYVALIVMFIIHLILIAINGLNPLTYVRKTLPVLTFAFTSRTSAGTLPLNVDTQVKKLGISDGIANFSASFGISIGQNGCAGIYPAMLAIMIAPTAGIDPFSFSFIATVIAVVTVSSFGVAGVGGGATFAALIVLSTLNLPVALAGLLISVEPLIDMGRTALNVSGSMTSGLITSKWTKELDVSVYNSPNRTEDAGDSALSV